MDLSIFFFFFFLELGLILANIFGGSRLFYFMILGIKMRDDIGCKMADDLVLEEDGGMNKSGEEIVAAAQKKYSIVGGFPQPMKVVVVGYALTSKKTKSFLQPKLEGLAR